MRPDEMFSQPEVKLDEREVQKVSEELGLVLTRTARYRIYLFFMGDFSTKKVNRGLITLFLSGKSSGVDIDMDQKVYECPNEECIGVLEPKHYSTSGPAVCPRCHRAHRQEDLVGEMMYDATADNWAAHLERYARALQMDCDILLHRLKTKQSIIEADHISRKDSKTGAVLLENARKSEIAIYTMDRIIQDTSEGKSLKTAIRAFLLA